jgi:hypothetical protein
MLRSMSKLQRLSMMNASGIATHKNHGPPLAAVINQITKVAMTTPSQNCQMAGWLPR